MEENLRKQLELLAEGEEMTVTEGDELVTYRKPYPPIICTEHQFMPVEDGEQCVLCGQGRINPRL